jgi:hypothetical protein
VPLHIENGARPFIDIQHGNLILGRVNDDEAIALVHDSPQARCRFSR